jgi:peptide/nickel transport system permease protein
MSLVPLPEVVTGAAETTPAVASHGYWSETWRRFRRKPVAVIALTYVGFMAVVGVFSPVLVGSKPILVKYKGHLSVPAVGYYFAGWESRLQVAKELRKRYTIDSLKAKDPQSWALYPLVYQDPYRRMRDNEWPDRPGNLTGDQGHPNDYNILGTTQEGYDVLAQIVHGTRTALLVGFVAVGIAGLIGITVGALAGYFEGTSANFVDTLLSRVMEVVMCVPSLVLILALLAVVERPTIWHTMVIIGVTSWPGIARLTRAEFLKLKKLDYVAAARALGAGHSRIMFRHILPNALAPVLVPITFGIASAILVENALSFLGFGSPPPTASWGNLLSAGQRNPSMWWLIVYPGAAIFLTVLAYNVIGEGLQEATDPRLREDAK